MGLFSFLKKKFSSRDDETKKYKKGLKKSHHKLSSSFLNVSKKYPKANALYFEELEMILIEADISVPLVIKTLDKLSSEVQKRKLTNTYEINELLMEELFNSYQEKSDDDFFELDFKNNTPQVILVVGVNGAGKTTSIAKLASFYQKQDKKVMLVAADTFRPGAKEQLNIWAKRLKCQIVFGEENEDPASVAYKGAREALKENVDLLIVDTAGRLQTKTNLMKELSKISRVLGREINNAPHQTFLIIDATTGQNGIFQAKAFKEATNISGIIMTKMDGTSKGGILLSIREELGVPVRYIGLGEQLDDFELFDLDKYLYGLLIGE
ncbi:MAG: signal recognition particle-docking protein FtsY [Bacilli bacterium]|jgi:fused signal recognition particle receptor|nr:signal recognition particle-docking protein FtsY [Bacilli bacterium]NLN79880.1 signal recognition particle-docking protein FtsY [Erysipelotrichia bacterium]